MSSFRLVVLSDTHVSRTHPYFFHNWEVALEAANVLAPDVVLVTGDVTFNGPDVPDDLTFGAKQMQRLAAPVVRTVPGNHDIGYSPAAASMRQLMTPGRRQAWTECFGPDFWWFDHGDWRFVGLNAFLYESGDEAEEAQDSMLDEALRGHDRPVGIFLHVPPFAHDPDETDDATTGTLRPAARKRLLDACAEAGSVRFIASGHLHRDKRMRFRDIDFIWAPGTAFMSTGPRATAWGGDPWVGFLDFRFVGDSYSVEKVEPEDMLNIDLRNWARGEKHRYFDIASQPFRRAD